MLNVAKRDATEAPRKHSTAAAGKPARFVTAVAVLLVMGVAGSRPAGADMTVVQQDATPIVSQPGVGGLILTHVAAGFHLIVLGSDGEWLRVASPQLKLTGNLWVPAGRVGDVIAAPADLALPEPASATADVPQFRIVTDRAGGIATTSLGTAALVGPRDSNGVSAAVARSTFGNTAGGTARGTDSSTPSAAAATTPSDNPVPAKGNSTPAVSGNSTPALGNPTPAKGNPTSAVSGNPTPAPGNPTPAPGNPTPAMGNPTPAMGNPTPAPGNPTPAMGSSTPALGSSVVGFSN